MPARAGQDGFAIAMPARCDTSGAESEYCRFGFEIGWIAERDELPDFAPAIERATTGAPLLRMRRRADGTVPRDPVDRPCAGTPRREAPVPTSGTTLPGTGTR
ncbi:hypothetical protein LPN01_11010 [Sphingomonas sp. A2-49]|uniref:hypothetical protein n=1 Tax=Sphingomonas sp. A2-49 TaxID=1391375 RepID=UPI0021D2941C|nr:hypothetical protein [Sphingomonas sp. A2-49]MCU6454607.1 hypothetical protein [Sphingomonas sp. A2-49]